MSDTGTVRDWGNCAVRASINGVAETSATVYTLPAFTHDTSRSSVSSGPLSTTSLPSRPILVCAHLSRLLYGARLEAVHGSQRDGSWSRIPVSIGSLPSMMHVFLVLYILSSPLFAADAFSIIRLLTLWTLLLHSAHTLPHRCQASEFSPTTRVQQYLMPKLNQRVLPNLGAATERMKREGRHW